MSEKQKKQTTENLSEKSSKFVSEKTEHKQEKKLKAGSTAATTNKEKLNKKQETALSGSVKNRAAEKPRKKDLIKKKSGFTVRKGIVVSVVVTLVVLIAVLLSIIVAAVVGIVRPAKEPINTFPDELGLYYEFHEIQAPNGKKMAGWFIPSQPQNTGDVNEQAQTTVSERTVVLSHSYKDNKNMTLLNITYLARDLADAGYNVVMFDYSGSGSSEGEGYTFGTRETDELRCVLDYFEQEKNLHQFALAGWSFGAASALMEGADDSRVQVIIADSPYVDLYSTFRSDFSRWSGLPEGFSPFVRAGVEWFSGVDLYRDSPLSACSRMDGKTLLFIGGDSDEVFGSDSCQTLAAAVDSSKNSVEVWTVENCTHMEAWTIEEANYRNRVLHTLNVAYGLEQEQSETPTESAA